jgi:hypothetical protein
MTAPRTIRIVISLTGPLATAVLGATGMILTRLPVGGLGREEIGNG